jgi:hypothetical protein
MKYKVIDPIMHNGKIVYADEIIEINEDTIKNFEKEKELKMKIEGKRLMLRRKKDEKNIK